jgi:hypothetical protein
MINPESLAVLIIGAGGLLAGCFGLVYVIRNQNSNQTEEVKIR